MGLVVVSVIGSVVKGVWCIVCLHYWVLGLVC